MQLEAIFGCTAAMFDATSVGDSCSGIGIGKWQQSISNNIFEGQEGPSRMLVRNIYYFTRSGLTSFYYCYCYYYYYYDPGHLFYPAILLRSVNSGLAQPKKTPIPVGCNFLNLYIHFRHTYNQAYHAIEIDSVKCTAGTYFYSHNIVKKNSYFWLGILAFSLHISFCTNMPWQVDRRLI